MPWREVSVMGERQEFVRLALEEGVNRRELCRRFGISPDIGYKWLARWKAGDRELLDRSRRPHVSPRQSSAAMEAAVLAVRDTHPAWGARKIARFLERQGQQSPAPSTVHAILKRHERIMPPPRGARATQRFEKAAPNLLWQMDFKGWVRLDNATPCHPLTMIDDHSRYVPGLAACGNQQEATVRGHLERTFRRYGTLFSPTTGPPGAVLGASIWTKLGIWLLKLGVGLLHSRPYHPQSRGKNERFHRTLKAEVFDFSRFSDLPAVQRPFDAWRELYNPVS